MTNDPRLYGILDLGYVTEANAAATTTCLLEGGIGLLQLRAKHHAPATIARVAALLLPLCRAAGVPFVLNDHPELAAQLGADGAHLGQDDGPLAAARHTLGPGKILGRSTHSLAQARAALVEGFDYIGFGPLFATPTKPGRPAIGLHDIATMEREVAALKEILDDPHNNHGPADQEGDASYVLAGAFIVVLGDTTFSEFVKSQNSDVQRSMFGGLLTGPWQHTETELAHRYPKTNSLRWRLFEAKPHQQEDEQAVRSDGHKPSSSVSTARSTAPAYAH